MFAKTYGEAQSVEFACPTDVEDEPEEDTEKAPLLRTVQVEEGDDLTKPTKAQSSFSSIFKESTAMVVFFGMNSILATSLVVSSFFSFLLPLFADGLFFTVAGLTSLGGFVGARNQYRLGNMSETMERLKQATNEYEMEIGKLTATKERLGEEVTQLQSSVKSLQEHGTELDHQLDEMEGIKQSLSELVGENETIDKMLDSVNGAFSDMKRIIRSNERAQLLSLYYEVEFRDGEEGMDRKEWQRFLARLSVKTRTLFEAIGFDTIAGADGTIDLKEMSRTIEQVMDKTSFEIAL